MIPTLILAGLIVGIVLLFKKALCVLPQIGMIIAAAFILLGLVYSPAYNFGPPVLVGETKLVSLSTSLGTEGHGNVFYVSINSSNVYSYRFETNDANYASEEIKTYEVFTVSRGEYTNVIEAEDPECKVPVIRQYVKEAKVGLWSLGLIDTTDYVFYVPEGTIGKDVDLK